MKISIIGSGDVGSHAAHEIAGRQIADEIVLLDIVDGLPQGRALDIRNYCPTIESETMMIGTNSYSDTKNSDIVVIVAGNARKAGMGSRDELLETNKNIVRSVTESVVNYSPNALIMVVTNPVDVMTYVAYKVSGFEKNRVFGMAGVLDTARLKCFIADKADCSLRDIETIVMGSHGEGMVPVFSKTKIRHRSVSEFLTGKDMEEVTTKTRQAGKNIVELTGKSGLFAPGGAIAKMIEIIINDTREILPCSAYLEGEYGLTDICICVPVVLGRNGIENIVEFELDEKERAMFDKCAEGIKASIRKLTGPGEDRTENAVKMGDDIDIEDNGELEGSSSDDEAITKIRADIAKIEQDLIIKSKGDVGKQSQPPIEEGSSSPRNPKKLLS
ncbi:MAG: malate dehydrogenase [Candidatus Aenigmarchaeota archaeon]|nr:malate dehydrogenase [Candidatus Aenigmarchaeota archaeon]